MLRLTRKVLRRVAALVSPAPAGTPSPPAPGLNKYDAEAEFWRLEIGQYVAWYNGDVDLYGTAPPTAAQKHTGFGQPLDAIETWLHLHQLPKYPNNLCLPADALRGLRVLDIGCGPFPGLRAFSGCAGRVGVDPLVTVYDDIGFPLGRWSDGYVYCRTRAESMPFPSASFDAVISCNAIDHVDDFAEVAKEVQRVLKPGGKLCMEVHYHNRTITEPLELNDEVFLANYGWVEGLRKAKDATSTNQGGTVAGPGERYVVWTNIESAEPPRV